MDFRVSFIIEDIKTSSGFFFSAIPKKKIPEEVLISSIIILFICVNINNFDASFIGYSSVSRSIELGVNGAQLSCLGMFCHTNFIRYFLLYSFQFFFSQTLLHTVSLLRLLKHFCLCCSSMKVFIWPQQFVFDIIHSCNEIMGSLPF